MEAFAFSATKAAQWPDLFIAYESFKFVTGQQATGNRFPNREITFVICACETFEPLDNGRTTLGTLTERLCVRHVIVRVKVFSLTDDVVLEFAVISHGCVSLNVA